MATRSTRRRLAGEAVTARELSGAPSLRQMYARVVGLGLLKRAGVLGRGNELPPLELTVSDITTERDHLAAYARTCGFRIGDTLPPTYPHVLAFPLALRLMTDRVRRFQSDCRLTRDLFHERRRSDRVRRG